MFVTLCYSEELASASGRLHIWREGSVDQVYDQLVSIPAAHWQTADYSHLLASRRVVHQGNRPQGIDSLDRVCSLVSGSR